MSLRKKIIRLAHEKPELREVLLPLVKKAGNKNFFHETISDLLFRENPSKYSALGTVMVVEYENNDYLPVKIELQLDLRNPTILRVVIVKDMGEDTHNIDLSKHTKSSASQEIVRFIEWHKQEEGY